MANYKKKVYSFRLDEKMMEMDFMKIAEEENRTQANLLEKIIKDFIRKVKSRGRAPMNLGARIDIKIGKDNPKLTSK